MLKIWSSGKKSLITVAISEVTYQPALMRMPSLFAFQTQQRPKMAFIQLTNVSETDMDLYWSQRNGINCFFCGPAKYYQYLPKELQKMGQPRLSEHLSQIKLFLHVRVDIAIISTLFEASSDMHAFKFEDKYNN